MKSKNDSDFGYLKDKEELRLYSNSGKDLINCIKNNPINEDEIDHS
jgi:hypothetical protein